MHRGYINHGYCGDFDRQDFYDGRHAQNPIVRVKGVTHNATGMVDELIGSNMAALEMALRQIIDARLENYTRQHINARPDGELKISEDKNIFGVAYFSSATSDKRLSLETAADYGKFLAEERLALISGGGNQHLMWACPKAYIKHNGLWYGAISTFGLVAKETTAGHLPREAKMSRLTETLGTRIETLLDVPDQYTAWDGGRGTGQEASSFLSAQKLRPDLVKNKKFYFFDPYANYKTSYMSIQALHIDAMLGEGAYKKMCKDHDVFAHLNVFLATEVNGLKRETLKNAGECEAQRNLVANQPPLPKQSYG